MMLAVTIRKAVTVNGIGRAQGEQRCVKRRVQCGVRATVPIEDIWSEKIRGCSYRGGNTSCLAVNLQTYREARQKVRYSLIATNFRFAAK